MGYKKRLFITIVVVIVSVCVGIFGSMAFYNYKIRHTYVEEYGLGTEYGYFLTEYGASLTKEQYDYMHGHNEYSGQYERVTDSQLLKMNVELINECFMDTEKYGEVKYVDKADIRNNKMQKYGEFLFE